jgi:proton-translocating NAD(P)+ transhydrogenase subunit alpha
VRDTGEELGGRLMQTSQIVIELTVLVLAIFVGVEVISKVPTLLHTPLMSGTNAIHGIVLVGAIIVAGLPHQVTWIRVVALTAVALGTINVVGGFVVTDRMLAMFKGKRRDAEPAQPVIGEGGRVERVRENREARATSTSHHDGR